VLATRGKHSPELVWNPRRGYSCSDCDWKLKVHIQPELPPEGDMVLQMVREQFERHAQETHGQSDLRMAK